MKTKDKFRKAMESMFRDTFVNNPKTFDAMCDIFEFVDDEPAKKEPVKFDEWTASLENFTYQVVGSMRSFVEAWMKDAWQASEQNRDLLYVDLIEHIEKHWRTIETAEIIAKIKSNKLD